MGQNRIFGLCREQTHGLNYQPVSGDLGHNEEVEEERHDVKKSLNAVFVRIS